MTYSEALAYIHGANWRGSKLGLSRTFALLELLGNPQKTLRFIHVAGTNGKGSTCAMLSSILQAAGYRTGLFVSPFVNRFNERMQYNNRPIPDEVLVSLVEQVQPIVDAMAQPPTEFELITCLAFLYYQRMQCDIVVLEVGLGGEFDATNVIDTPLLAVITAIDYDHMHILGNTITAIATAKAGIIKPNGDVLFYGKNDEAERVLRVRAAQMQARLTVCDHRALQAGTFGIEGQTFSYGKLQNVRLALLGAYQLDNVALVLDAISFLNAHGLPVSESAVREGLMTVHWPARFELLRREPPFFVDGGHNPQGVRATVETFQRLYPQQQAVVVMGMMRDKDVDASIRALLPIAKRFCTATPDNARALPADALAERIRSFGGTAEAFDSVSAAVEYAASCGEIGLAVGSLYMAGAVRAFFGRTT